MKRFILILLCTITLATLQLNALSDDEVLAEIDLFSQQALSQEQSTERQINVLSQRIDIPTDLGLGQREVQEIDGDISSEMLNSQLVQDMLPFFHAARINLANVKVKIEIFNQTKGSAILGHKRTEKKLFTHLHDQAERIKVKLATSMLSPEQALEQLSRLKQHQTTPLDLSIYDSQERALRAQYDAAKQEFDKWHNDIKSVLLDPAKRQHEKEMVEANMMVDVMKAREAAKAKAVEDNKHYAEHSKQDHEQRLAMSKFLLGGGAAATAATMLSYYLMRHYFAPRPTIIERTDTSMLSRFERLRGWRVPAANLQNLVLSPVLEEKVTGKFDGIALAIRQGLPLSNMLFHGPAGTGKTMAAQSLARSLHEQNVAHHVIIRGGAFKRLGSAGKAQKALSDVLRWASTSSKPVILVFDEAETMFVDRESEHANEITRELTVAMLSFFERAVNNNMMFILSTNLPHRLDRALLNRIDPSNRVKFAAPGRSELINLLKVYLNEHLTKNDFTVPQAVMDNLPGIADKMPGTVGRQVDSFVAQLIYPMLNEQTKTLDPVMIDRAIAAQRAPEALTAY